MARKRGITQLLELFRHVSKQTRDVWHVMGHPKLLSERSLRRLGDFADAAGVAETVTVATFAGRF